MHLLTITQENFQPTKITLKCLKSMDIKQIMSQIKKLVYEIV